MTVLPRHKLTIKSSDGQSVTMLMGEIAPRMTAGGGGWSVIARPRRVGLTQWQGRDPYQMEIPVLFDAWSVDGDSVEEEIARLNQMQMGKDNDPPPTIIISGAIPVKNIRWVITTIDWGANVIWNVGQSGKPVRERQDAVIHVMQYVKEDRLVTLNKTPAPRTHRYKKGETLRQIAQKWYKDANKWKKIAEANNIRDPSNIKDGIQLRIP